MTDAETGRRLDRFLADRIPTRSRTAWQRAIERAEVTVNDSTCPPARRLDAGDVVRCPLPQDAEMLPAENLPLNVIHEDETIIVVNKPPGLVVHPTTEGRKGTLANRLIGRYGQLSAVGGILRPGIVHRLDRMTSGVMVIARDDESHRSLAAQFKARTVAKIYHALVAGRVDLDADVVRRAIRRHPRLRDRMAPTSDEMGKSAQSTYRVLERLGGLTLVAVEPRTGRTHQVRVHMRVIGHPIVADRKYGGPVLRTAAGESLIDRTALHAHAIAFDHPRTGQRLQFEAPWAEDFARAVDLARRTPEPLPR